jgi:hypothetical protein
MNCYRDSFTFYKIMIFVPHRRHDELLQGQLYFL